MVAQNSVRLFVYALCEPDGTTIRYVGLTSDLWKRYKAHVGHSCMPAVKKWIDELRSLGLLPSLVVLQQVYGIEQGRDAEAKAIRKYKRELGDRLLNETYVGLAVPRDRNGRVTFDGRRQTLGAWAKELGISRQALHFRLQRHPVKIALSRGKNQSEPLAKKPRRRLVSPIAVAMPTVIEIDQKHCVRRGLTHAERRERREAMAGAIARGAITQDVADAYGVTTATVNQAIKEYLPLGVTAEPATK